MTDTWQPSFISCTAPVHHHDEWTLLILAQKYSCTRPWGQKCFQTTGGGGAVTGSGGGWVSLGLHILPLNCPQHVAVPGKET